MNRQASPIRTWADAFGTWHAAVPTTHSRPAMAARRVILAELDARQGEPVDRKRLRVRKCPNHDAQPGHVIYAESWSE